LLVELQSARLCAELAPSVEVVTYRQREPGHLFLADLLQQEATPGEALWIVSWGFDVPALLRQLRGRPVSYHAHSSGYGFQLPPGVPVLAVKLQELFGCNDGPRVLGGRLPVSLQLLSPAGRPAAITSDLASFWRSGYRQVRADLRGRYPRHYWPEDPLQAEPTRGVRRPRD
jgi:hypothetical protein